MAWLKIETNTPNKPEVRKISKLCNCSIADAFLAFFRFYSWADGETADGNIAHISKSDADDIAELPGFGVAAEDVGWITFGEHGLIIHRWDRHNGESAKKRCTLAERKRQERLSHS